MMTFARLELVEVPSEPAFWISKLPALIVRSNNCAELKVASAAAPRTTLPAPALMTSAPPRSAPPSVRVVAASVTVQVCAPPIL